MNLSALNFIRKRIRKSKRRLKKIYRKFFIPLFLRFFRKGLFDFQKILIICGSGRSGTTWLAELINNIPGSVIIFEPLSPKANSHAKKAGFGKKVIIEPGETSIHFNKYFDNLFNLKYLEPWDTKFIPTNKVFNVEYFIFKFIRANLLLKWLTECFRLRKPVLILRHPCAVISSRIKVNWVENIVKKDVDYSGYPLFERIQKNINFKEEEFALSWCRDNFIPLSQNETNSFIVTSYEGLITNPEKELKRIFESWEIEMPQEILSKLNVPSNTFNMNPNDKYINEGRIDSKKLLSRWKSDLDSEQIDRILNIVNKVGMDFYSEELEPDYERLYGNKPLGNISTI